MKIAAIYCLGLLMMIGTTAMAQQVVPPPSLCPLPCNYYLTFVSDGVTYADSTNINDYNAFVTSQAAQLNAMLSASGVSGSSQWYALGSTSTVNAVDNIGANTRPAYPVFNIQNAPGPYKVSNSPLDLLNQPLFVGNNIGQLGRFYANFNAWTGTSNTGGVATGTPLGDPTSVSHSNVVGALTNWIDTGNQPPHYLEQMYAVSSPLTIACVPPPNTTMVAWYTFDETSGKTSKDIAAGNTGTWHGSPTPVTGEVLNGLKLNGTTDYVEAPSSIAINFGPASSPSTCTSNGNTSACPGNFTIDAWIKVNGLYFGVATIVDKRGGSAPNINGYSLFLYSGQIGLQLADGTGTGFDNYLSGPLPGAGLSPGAWHHIAVTVNRTSATGITFFYDGNQAPFTTAASRNPLGRPGSLASKSVLRIGTRTADSALTASFPGSIDELEIFNRELQQPEVKNIYLAKTFGKCKP